jgi:hypothetical protein
MDEYINIHMICRALSGCPGFPGSELYEYKHSDKDCNDESINIAIQHYAEYYSDKLFEQPKLTIVVNRRNNVK